MGRSEDAMPGAINGGALFLGVGAPQHKDDGGLSPINRRYHCVSKALPTLTLMRSGDAVLN